MRKILITGATGGLGKAFSKHYASKNDHLYLQGRSYEKLSELSTQLATKTTLLVADFSYHDDLDNFISEIKDVSFDVVINNAGFGYYGSFHKMDERTIETMINTNITALTRISYTVLQRMIEINKGAILNVGSVASYLPGPYMAQYYATKAYVLSLSEALYQEVKEHNIIVSCLCPGPVRTQFHIRANVNKDTIFYKMFTDTVEFVIDKAITGLERGKRVVVPGLFNKLSVISSKVVPKSVMLVVMNQIQKRR